MRLVFSCEVGNGAGAAIAEAETNVKRTAAKIRVNMKLPLYETEGVPAYVPGFKAWSRLA